MVKKASLHWARRGQCPVAAAIATAIQQRQRALQDARQALLSPQPAAAEPLSRRESHENHDRLVNTLPSRTRLEWVRDEIAKHAEPPAGGVLRREYTGLCTDQFYPQ